MSACGASSNSYGNLLLAMMPEQTQRTLLDDRKPVSVDVDMLVAQPRQPIEHMSIPESA